MTPKGGWRGRGAILTRVWGDGVWSAGDGGGFLSAQVPPRLQTLGSELNLKKTFQLYLPTNL